jgi:hypothetical protein
VPAREIPVAALQICGVSSVRHCRDDERADILAIVNAAACRGVIALDRWQEPYVPARELDSEITSGVAFLSMRQTLCWSP